MVGGSESWEQNNYGMELCLDGGVRGGNVSLGGSRPGLWVRGGLLFLMEAQRLKDAVGLDGLVGEVNRGGLHRGVLHDSGSRWRGQKVAACNWRQVDSLAW